MTQQSAIAALAASFMGALVIANDKAGTEIGRYRITSLSDKIGTLKDGSKGEYVVLTDVNNTNVVMQLHPNSARKLLKTLTCDTLHLVPEAHAAAAKATEAAPEATKPIPAVAAANAPTVTPAAAPVQVAPAAPKEASKKERTVAMFKTMTAAGQPRKDIIARMKTELGLSAPGANTYYQNCKSGAWK